MPGHLEVIGETIAKFELYQNGWNPFQHFVDEDQVDLLARRRPPGGRAVYREIQVKHGRFYPTEAGWAQEMFARTAWRNFDRNEFAEQRQNFFVMLVLGGTTDFQYAGDTFIFKGSEFHALLQRLPAFGGGDRVVMYLSLATNGRWYVRLNRNRIQAINPETCVDVTRAWRNFGILG